MKHKDGRAVFQPDKNSRTIPITIMVVILCGLSFYLGVIFSSEKMRFKSTVSPDLSKLVKKETSNTLQIQAPPPLQPILFQACSIDYQDYTPCTDPRRWKRYSLHRLTFLERHCPPISERKECLVPPPPGYRIPIRWPKSRDECWYRNVPYEWINKEKSNQHWLRKSGEKFFFPGGGTMFPRGVGAYVDSMQELLPEMKDGTIRTALDTGCGVASWGNDMLDRGILTLSLAPRDNHEAQVQFALERGLPTMLGVLSTQRLPYPSSAFDMAHCSRCLIPWTEFDGIYLLEIQRLLRPGGFWVLTGPPINYEARWKGWATTVEEQKANQEKLQRVLASMCFKMHIKKGDFAIWQKSTDINCYKKIDNPEAQPPTCDDSLEPDAAWYTPLRPCVVAPSERTTDLKSIPKWPARLNITPNRIREIPGGSGDGFKNDSDQWKQRANHYKKLLPQLGTDAIRNVMDMNTVFGGLSAALIDDPVWVMNVVSSYALNTLGIIYDRGLIGTYHDWCEPFSTYPRTYDLLHLDRLFTAESHRCDIKYVLLEMDRILRPTGYAIIRESNYFMDPVSNIAKAMRWDCRKEDAEMGDAKEYILICQKQLWFSSNQTSQQSP